MRALLIRRSDTQIRKDILRRWIAGMTDGLTQLGKQERKSASEGREDRQ